MNAILTLNSGSSSIKFALFAATGTINSCAELYGQIDGIGARPHIKAMDKNGQRIDDVDIPLSGDSDKQHHEALEFLVNWLHAHEAGWQVIGVGHRIVHGGQDYSRPMVLDDASLAQLRLLIPLAPLHQPHNLEGVDAMRAHLPHIPQIACFDTAFHRTQPEVAQRFALPRWLSEKGLRRYGFHGLSYEYIASTLPRHLGPKAAGRIVVAHLGNGASACAMHNGKSMATSMGFSPIEGLVMGTRTGSIDPGVLIYLMEFEGLGWKGLVNLLCKESGLLGVSGISQDMRTLLKSQEPTAKEAVELFCYRLVREIGALAATLGGLDAVVFTGGIGEHAAPVRAAVCQALAWMGLELDAAANGTNATRISTADSRIDALVIPTNEEWMVAMHTADLLP
ncbi:MAG: acetate/propionate family kinase [Rhodocyclaceae bacterium]|nr:acetate/propionate family kinase [Rhodocyclaceae bacterium]